MDTYEMKREIVNFLKRIATGVNKSTQKFLMDMQYGIAKSGSYLISEISRGLKEKIFIFLIKPTILIKKIMRISKLK